VNSIPHPGERGYPRPQLERDGWTSLNGQWDFVIDAEAHWTSPGHVRWNASIEVPFSPETAASGIEDTGLYRACWYRRRFTHDRPGPGHRVFLHFGAVDYAGTVWVNGRLATRHRGGYTPFHADITDLLDPSGEQEVVVRAEDDPDDLAKPRGKQDWRLEPHSIWYYRTTGIWQTVWLEEVPATRIGSLRWTPNLERWEIALDLRLEGERRFEPFVLRATLSVRDQVLARDEYLVDAGEVHRRIALSDPGIDDYRNELLWRPSRPTLIDAAFELVSEDGTVVDVVRSYTALRTISLEGDRFLLNGRPFPLRLVLDQGYWPESGLTAPDDEALRRDVDLAKAMGFNGVRKHQKVEDPRYLYWADRLGLLVWGEMPSAYRYTRRSIELLTREWMEALDRDYSHPCIVTWVPFNESWGVPNLPNVPEHRHWVQALYHLTKTLDPTRPVIGNDGWESVATDIIGIHDYAEDAMTLQRRYQTQDVLPRVLRRDRPGGRMITLDVDGGHERPVMLTEFGGIAHAPSRDRNWGYSRTHSPEDLAVRYTQLLEVVRDLPLLAGFCYTQFADTYQESNGLLYADRTPKFPLEQIRAATAGLSAHEQWVAAGFAGEINV
jgi:beta-galactosidase/beta-glucuronidase